MLDQLDNLRRGKTDRRQDNENREHACRIGLLSKSVTIALLYHLREEGRRLAAECQLCGQLSVMRTLD